MREVCICSRRASSVGVSGYSDLGSGAEEPLFGEVGAKRAGRIEQTYTVSGTAGWGVGFRARGHRWEKWVRSVRDAFIRRPISRASPVVECCFCLR